jgi:hypothetical protein
MSDKEFEIIRTFDETNIFNDPSIIQRTVVARHIPTDKDFYARFWITKELVDDTEFDKQKYVDDLILSVWESLNVGS